MERLRLALSVAAELSLAMGAGLLIGWAVSASAWVS